MSCLIFNFSCLSECEDELSKLSGLSLQVPLEVNISVVHAFNFQWHFLVCLFWLLLLGICQQRGDGVRAVSIAAKKVPTHPMHKERLRRYKV